MDITLFTNRYRVRRLDRADVPDVYSLCGKNRLYYEYCPPAVTKQSIIRDMDALPAGKDVRDKYYVGYYDGEKLIAVLDIITAYPEDKTAFIGFFMTDVSVQNSGVGSGIISDLLLYLKGSGFSGVQLGWIEGNPQAEHFWHKNGFAQMETVHDASGHTVVKARREL
ncbi:MAG: GNAT family N-acetyltransferase [Oscillospiraceae bacterium]|nr:GNAT family N-acetyltransferase [Oscillospiraceae bacterium]